MPGGPGSLIPGIPRALITLQGMKQLIGWLGVLSIVAVSLSAIEPAQASTDTITVVRPDAKSVCTFTEPHPSLDTTVFFAMISQTSLADKYSCQATHPGTERHNYWVIHHHYSSTGADFWTWCPNYVC